VLLPPDPQYGCNGELTTEQRYCERRVYCSKGFCLAKMKWPGRMERSGPRI
jgi:hypothetical protein